MDKNVTKWIIGIIIIAIIIIGAVLIFTPEETGTIRIGLAEDLSGAFANYGQWGLEGAQLAVEELKEEGINVELVIEDTQTDAKTAVTVIHKLIDVDNIKIIISGSLTNSIMAMAPIAEEKKTILFATLSSGPSVTNAGDYIFRNRISGKFEVEKLAEVLKKDFNNITKVAVLALNDESGQSYVEVFERAFEGDKRNSETIFYNAGQSDFKTEIAKMKQSAPEAVILLGPVKDMAFFIRQATGLGFKPRFFSISSIQSNQLFEIAGDSAEGLIFATETIQKDNPNYLLLQQKYKQKYGGEPTIYVVNSYDAVKMLAKIIKSVGYDADKVKAELYNIKYEGAGGTMKFDVNGDVIKGIALKQVQNRTFVDY